MVAEVLLRHQSKGILHEEEAAVMRRVREGGSQGDPSLEYPRVCCWSSVASGDPAIGLLAMREQFFYSSRVMSHV